MLNWKYCKDFIAFEDDCIEVDAGGSRKNSCLKLYLLAHGSGKKMVGRY